MGYVGGDSRGQGALFPVVLDDLVADDHAVRVIDAFVGGLDLGQLGFERAQPAVTGRPGYDPADLLRLYLYGYLNQVRSSRRLERECARNVELMWLLSRLVPDHKTISDFRRVNAEPFKAVCRAFVRFCVEAQLTGGQWVAIDGSKFQAVAGKRSVVSARQLEAQIEKLDGQVQTYLASLDAADDAEGDAGEADKAAVRAALARLKQQRTRAVSTQAILKERGETHRVIAEPEAKVMKTGEGPSVVGYNLQSAVDAKNKLIVHHELINEGYDQRSLLPVATGAKAALGVDKLKVVADAGYSNGQQAKQCEEAGIEPHVPAQRTVNPGGYFERSAFSYDEHSDSYRCPAGETLRRKAMQTADRLVIYTTSACGGCALKAQCTGAKQRYVSRHFEEDVFERMLRRLDENPQVMALRRAVVEHPFANLKYRILGNGRFLLRGLRGARAEMALAVLAYNFKRALNLLGSARMREQLVVRGT